MKLHFTTSFTALFITSIAVYSLAMYRVLHNKHRSILLSNVSDILKIDVNILPETHLNELLLYGCQVYNVVVNKLIVRETIRFVKKTGRFNIMEAFL